MIFDRLFRRTPDLKAADALFAAVVAQSRRPEFYRELGVPDTLDGRFDMINLHVVLVMRRLKHKDHAPVSQALFDAYFKNLDSSLREMGVGDLTVPKRIRVMAEAFYGRVKAYESAFADDAPEDALALAITRNVFRSEDGEPLTPAAQTLAAYMRHQDDHLRTLGDDAVAAGEASFTAPDLSGLQGRPAPTDTVGAP